MYIRQTENMAETNKRYLLLTSSIFQPVKQPESCICGNSRLLIPQAIAVAGGWGKRGWGTGTSIYPACPSAKATLLGVNAKNKVLTANNASGK